MARPPLICLAFCLLVAGFAQAQLTRTIDSATVRHDYLLDSDEVDGDSQTNRHTALTDVAVTISLGPNALSATAHSGTYRLAYQMLDAAGDAILLSNGDDSGLAHTLSQSVSLNRFVFPFRTTATLQFELRPNPDDFLPAKDFYSISLQLEQFDTVANVWSPISSLASSTPPQQFLHFENTNPNDVAFNIRGRLGDVSLDEHYALRTAAGNDGSFDVSADVTLMRWDGFESVLSNASNLDYIVDFDLIEVSSGRSVPLQNDGRIIRQFAAFSHTLLSPFEPLIAIDTRVSGSIRPLEQLKNLSETYFLRATLSHTEQPDGTTLVDTVCDAASSPILHFSGNLDFSFVETTFDVLANEPPLLLNLNGRRRTQIDIPADGGSLPQRGDVSYSTNGNPITVLVADNGDASYYQGSGAQVIVAGNPGQRVRGTSGDVGLSYGTVILGGGGVSASDIVVELPQGLAYIENVQENRFLGESTFNIGSAALDRSLNPSSSIGVDLSLQRERAIVDESHPVMIEVEYLDLIAGEFRFAPKGVTHIHDEAMVHIDALADAQMITRAEAIRPSNDSYLRKLGIHSPPANEPDAVSVAPDGTARLQTVFVTSSQDMASHFPAGAELPVAQDSFVSLMAGSPNGSTLDSVPSVQTGYFQTCPGDDCTRLIPEVRLTHLNESGRLDITPGGGLYAAGSTESHEIQWGVRAPGRPAHRVDPLSTSRVYIPGYQLYAADNALIGRLRLERESTDLAPALLLLAAYNEKSATPELYQFGTVEYTQGEGALPGLNYTVPAGSHRGGSRLAGNLDEMTYEIIGDQPQGGSKYYLRRSGVSGRHSAREGTYDGDVSMHGFKVNLKRYELSFLDGSNDPNEAPGTDSWVDGGIVISGAYSEWGQSFTGMRFNCYGEPGPLTPDLSEANGKYLIAWDATFDLRTLQMHTEETNPGACPKQFTGSLIAGIETRVAHVPTPLFGRFAFSPDGNLSTAARPLGGVDSQLGLPPVIEIDGPSRPYQFVTSSKLRFSDPSLPEQPVIGTVSFAGSIDIPYFEDLQVQAITRARAGVGSPLWLTPGWTEGNETFFTKANFDPQHRNFPDGEISFFEYTEPDESTDEEFLLIAEQRFFGLLPIKYPLRWDFNTRQFSSMTEQKENIFISSFDHQIDRMDAQFTQISFGAKVDGLPDLSITNLVNGQLDGAASALANAIGAKAKEGIDKGLGGLDALLEDAAGKITDPIVDSMSDEIGTIYDFFVEKNDQAPTIAAYNAVIDSELDLAADDPVPDTSFAARLATGLETATSTADNASTLLGDVRTILEDIVKVIDILTGGTYQDSENEICYSKTAPGPDAVPAGKTYVRGILTETDGKLTVVQTVVERLLREALPANLASIVSILLSEQTGELNDDLNAELESIRPSLQNTKEGLLRLRGELVKLIDKIGDAEGLLGQFQTIASSSTDEFDSVSKALIARAYRIFREKQRAAGIDPESTDPTPTTSFIESEMSREDFIALIKAELRDQLLQATFVRQFQHILRQELYDLQLQLTSQMQGIFSNIANLLKEGLADSLADLESTINPLAGALSERFGQAEVTGYAEMNGDSLRKLRIDAKAQLKLPDEMEFNTYFEILAYNSEDNFTANGCLVPGEDYIEVRAGATDVSLDWIADIQANFGAKISLVGEVVNIRGNAVTVPVPIGVGGFVEMTGGSLDFQGFELKEFGATLAMGRDEAYLGCKARALFSNYEMAAGIFLGRTCTIEPLVFIDPDVADVITPGTPFTGAYVYGESWLPISELVLGVPASCMFRIDAGVGAGAFYFVEGPTYGGKMLLGVSGEALCVASIRGDIRMILAAQAGDLRGSGTGNFKAKIGPSPFDYTFRRSVKVRYNNGDWSMD